MLAVLVNPVSDPLVMAVIGCVLVHGKYGGRKRMHPRAL